MIKKNRLQLVISSVITLLPVVIGILIWKRLPERMATHWGAVGGADTWGARGFAVFGMPVIMLVVEWICIFFTARDPKNKDQSSKVFNMVLWIMPIISILTCGSVFAIALGNDVNIGIIIRIILGLAFVAIGNYMPKCRQNNTIGVKVKWALKNEENWNKTHRFAGRVWLYGGLIIIATIFVPMESIVYALFTLILLMAFSPMVYSYVYYRKQLSAGTVTKEDMKSTPLEKRAKGISLIVVTVILALVLLFTLSGKFEVKLDESSLTIEAVCWDNALVDYADIENIEYREQKITGARTFGYGTPFIIMGECENSEFGEYTRYTYSSCDSCIVIESGGRILVINGKSEEETKAVYDKLQTYLASY